MIFMFYYSDRDTPLDLELPNQWLWDVVDEFIYQSQEFSQYCLKLRGKTEEELNQLKSSAGVRCLCHIYDCSICSFPTLP